VYRFIYIRICLISLIWAGLYVVTPQAVQGELLHQTAAFETRDHTGDQRIQQHQVQQKADPGRHPYQIQESGGHSYEQQNLNQNQDQDQDPDRLTIEESIRRGLAYNWRLQAVSAESDEAEAARRQARSGRLPRLQAQASYTRLSDNVTDIDVTIPGMDSAITLFPVEVNRYHAELSLEQPIFTGGRLNNRIEAADRQAEAAGYREAQEQVELAFEIRQAWWNLYRAQVAHQTLEFALTQVEEHLRDVRNRVEEGTALRTELLNAETRRSEVRLEEIDTRSQVRLARLELNRLIGLPADAEPELAESEVTRTDQRERIPREMEQLVERALEQLPALDALSQQVQAGEAEVQATRANWLPELHLVGRYIQARPNQYFFDQQDQFRGTWEAGLALRWSLWDGGQRLHETGRSRARLRRAEAQLADMQEQATVNVVRRYLELERAVEAVSVAGQSAGSAEEAFNSIRLQFEEGAALSWQVLDAEQAYRQAQARQADAIADYEIARGALLLATGQIW